MTTPPKQFLLVDDDPTNNLLSKMIIKRALGDVNIKDFLASDEALTYIQTEFEHNPSKAEVTLFLDINMPSINGWEFLEQFNTFSDKLKKQFSIYILSSSIDPTDINRAKLNPLVVDFIEKPLNKTLLTQMFGEAIRQ
jgi:CheY-like chemotaxis protein